MFDNENRATAKKMLEENDALFCDMVDALDDWNGFADGFRAWEIDLLDDFYSGVSATKLLNDLRWNDFDLRDDYFYFSIYGLESTDDKAALYRDHTDSLEVLDNLLDNLPHIYFGGDDAEKLADVLRRIDLNESEND